MANPIKSLISQTAIYGLSSIAGRFLNYLLVPLYTNLFLANEYGVVTELYAYVSILLILLTYGMETGFFRFCQNTNFNRKTVYSTTLSSLFVTSLLFLIFVYFNIEGISSKIGYGNNSSYVLLLAFTVGLDALTAVPFAKLRIENKAKFFAIIKFLNIGLNIGLNLFFLLVVPAYFDDDNIFHRYFFEGRDVGYIFLANFIASLLTLLLLSKEILKAFKPYNFDFNLLKKILKYSYPLLFAGLAGMMSENLDRILIKYFVVVPEYLLNLIHSTGFYPDNLFTGNQYTMHQIGIYGANVKIAVLMTLFIQAFRYAAEPFFFNYSAKSDSKVMYARVMNYFIIFCLFIFLGVTLFIDYVKFIINENYHEGLAVVPILLISKLVFGIVFNLSIWYKLTNKTVFGALLAFIGAFISIMLNIVLIPKMGYIGCAWASIIAYFTMMLLSFTLMKKHFPISYNIKKIGIYFSLAFIIYFLNIYLRQITDNYLILNFLLIAVYLLIIVKIEKINIIQLYKSLLKK